jgi:hypothetical protein
MKPAISFHIISTAANYKGIIASVFLYNTIRNIFIIMRNRAQCQTPNKVDNSIHTTRFNQSCKYKNHI